MKFVSPAESRQAPAVELRLEDFLSDERWSLIGDLIPDGLLLVDHRGIVRYINSAAESINEVARADVMGRPLAEFIARSRFDCEALLGAFSEGARLNQVMRDPGGRSYALSTRCSRDWNGAVGCFMVIQRNLDVIAKLSARPPTESAGMSFMETGASDSVAGERDPVITGAATVMALERGLRAMAMGSRLLILGDSGVGKTELAKLLHRRSGHPDRPFIHLNCGSIPESLFESEMFGYERGSFTGASTRGKKGLIEAADGGTLFLDEIGEIPLHSQAKMLQVLEEGVVQRVGATAPRRLKIQLIAATNQDLTQLVNQGRFRRDLYYRISVVTVLLPPLRERRELLAPLLDRFLADVNRRRPTPLRLDAACRKRLAGYDYPGNVRELQNLVEHLAVVCDSAAGEADLPFLTQTVAEPIVAAPPPAQKAMDAGSLNFGAGFDLREVVRQYEAWLIEQTILCAGSKRKAAELLGVDIATIVRKSRFTAP
jgi:transcriptional regulator with PAS, ATPase and Fis domain